MSLPQNNKLRDYSRNFDYFEGFGLEKEVEKINPDFRIYSNNFMSFESIGVRSSKKFPGT